MEAARFCLQNCGELAQIESEAENEALKDYYFANYDRSFCPKYDRVNRIRFWIDFNAKGRFHDFREKDRLWRTGESNCLFVEFDNPDSVHTCTERDVKQDKWRINTLTRSSNLSSFHSVKNKLL